MTDLIHFGVLVVAVGMIGIGLWLIAPAYMWMGIGGLLMTGVVVGRVMSRPPKKVG